jgi:hypothetical protein
LIIPASAKDISMEKSPHFKPDQWLTSTNTMVAELVGNWATPQGMALVPLLAADPPMLPVY